jgi:hypothetical protein
MHHKIVSFWPISARHKELYLHTVFCEQNYQVSVGSPLALLPRPLHLLPVQP